MNQTDLMRRLRELRPDHRPGWAESAEGREVLGRLLVAPTARSRPAGWVRRAVVVAFGIAAVVAATSFVLLRQSPSPPLGDPPTGAKTVTFAGSYAFDVMNLVVLMDHADQVFVGQVVAVEANDGARQTRTYRVIASGVVQGSASGEVRVQQFGYVDGDGVVHILDDQPMLRVGKTYLLATASQSTEGPLFVMGGPRSVIEITSQEQEHDLVQRYREAAER